MTDARVSQSVIEGLVQADDNSARVTQSVIEALVQADDNSARVTQVCLEVLVEIPAADTGRTYGPALQ